MQTTPLKYLVSCNDEILSEQTEPDYEFDYIEIGSVECGKGITSTERMTYGKAPSRARRIVKNENLAYLIPDEKWLHYRYLYYNFKAMYLFLRGLVGESQAGIYQETIKQLYIPLPNLEEQHLISDYLDDCVCKLNNIISEKQSLIEDLEAYKKSLIYEVVTGKRKVVA